MSFPSELLTKLKDIVRIEIPIRVNIFNININSNNSTNHVDGRSLKLSTKDKETWPKVSALLATEIDAKEALVMATPAYLAYKRLGLPKCDEDKIRILRPVLRPVDIRAIKAALAVRKLFHEKANKDEVYLRKGEIRERFGDRGIKICDICSAGYLETMIIPLYHELAALPDGIRKFKDQFDIIVENNAFSVFIHGAMGVKSISTQILTQFGYNCRAGEHYVDIHAIGRQNIEKTKAAIDNILKHRKGTCDNKISDGETCSFFFVRLRLE